MSGPATKLAGRLALRAVLGAAALIGLRYVVVQPPPEPQPFIPSDLAFVRPYDPPRTKVDTMLIVSDGQAWATLAQDPTFSHPEEFYDGTQEFVYRSQRPLFPWLVWAASLGQAALVPIALMAWTCVGVGILAFGSVVLAANQGRIAKWGAVTVLLPGSVYVVLALGPEPLATGLAMLGVVWWRGPPRRAALAVLALTAAVLCRDVTVVVPVVLGLNELVRKDRRLRELVPLAVPCVALLGWIVALHQRYGYWPKPSKLEGVAPPMRGLWQALGTLDPLQVLFLGMGFALVGLAVRREPGSPLSWIGLAFAAVSMFFGRDVWSSEFFRVLLPMYAFCLIVVLPRVGQVNRRKVAVA